VPGVAGTCQAIRPIFSWLSHLLQAVGAAVDEDHALAEPAMIMWKSKTLACARETAEPFFSGFISNSKRSNFENRTESVESRASEISGPFGEQ
jgi:hypothetical protein